VPGSLRIFSLGADTAGAATVTGGGYLLQQVGDEFNVTTAGECLDAFAALAALHRLRVVHGDARVSNIVRIGGELRWIDVQSDCTYWERPSEFGDSAQYDAISLAKSVLCLGWLIQPPKTVETAAKAYGAALAQLHWSYSAYFTGGEEPEVAVAAATSALAAAVSKEAALG